MQVDSQAHYQQFPLLEKRKPTSGSGRSRANGGHHDSESDDGEKVLAAPRKVVREFFKRNDKLKHVMLKFDYFEFFPRPRLAYGRSFRSLLGVFGTALMMTVLIVYMMVTFVRFAKSRPSVSQSRIETNEENVTFPDFALVFREQDPETATPRRFMRNASYYYASYEMTTVNQQDQNRRNVTHIGMVPCDVSSWAGWLGSKALCPNGSSSIRGQYSSDVMTFVEVTVALCDPTITPAITGEDCAPAADIRRVVEDGRFNLIVKQELLTATEFERTEEASPQYFLYFVDTNLWLSNQLIWYQRFVDQAPNFLNTFSTKRRVILEHSHEKLVIHSARPIEKYGGILVLSIWSRLADFEVFESRQLQTSLDLIGSWGALFGVLAGGLGILFHRYNEHLFFRKYPRWKNMNANFEHDAKLREEKRRRKKEKKEKKKNRDAKRYQIAPMVSTPPADDAAKDTAPQALGAEENGKPIEPAEAGPDASPAVHDESPSPHRAPAAAALLPDGVFMINGVPHQLVEVRPKAVEAGAGGEVRGGGSPPAYATSSSSSSSEDELEEGSEEEEMILLPVSSHPGLQLL